MRRVVHELEVPFPVALVRWWCDAHPDDPATATLVRARKVRAGLAHPAVDAEPPGYEGAPRGHPAWTRPAATSIDTRPRVGLAPVALAHVVDSVLRLPRRGARDYGPRVASVQCLTVPQDPADNHAEVARDAAGTSTGGESRDASAERRPPLGRPAARGIGTRIVREVVTPLTARGGCPPRLWMGPLPRWAAAATLLGDVIRAFRPAEERAGIDDLRRPRPDTRGGAAARAERHASAPAAHDVLADARVRAFAQVLDRFGLHADAVEAAASLLRRGHRVLHDWTATVNPQQRYLRRRDVTQWESGCDATLALLRDAGAGPGSTRGGMGDEGGPDMAAARLRTAGDGGLVTPADLVALYAHLLVLLGALPRSSIGRARGPSGPTGDDAGGRHPDRARFLGWPPKAQRLALNVVLRARRFPVPGPDRPAGTVVGPGEPHLDRVDVLLAIYDAKPFARATTLLTGARRLLGHVLRDPAVPRAVLAEPTGVAPVTRRSLAVVLGLLGEAPPLDAALHGPDALAAAEAYALGAVLAHLGARDPTLAALDRAAAARPGAGAARVLDKARRRVETGTVLAVVG